MEYVNKLLIVNITYYYFTIILIQELFRFVYLVFFLFLIDPYLTRTIQPVEHTNTSAQGYTDLFTVLLRILKRSKVEILTTWYLLIYNFYYLFCSLIMILQISKSSQQQKYFGVFNPYLNKYYYSEIYQQLTSHNRGNYILHGYNKIYKILSFNSGHILIGDKNLSAICNYKIERR